MVRVIFGLATYYNNEKLFIVNAHEFAYFNKNIFEGLARFITFSVHFLEGLQKQAKK